MSVPDNDDDTTTTSSQSTHSRIIVRRRSHENINSSSSNNNIIDHKNYDSYNLTQSSSMLHHRREGRIISLLRLLPLGVIRTDIHAGFHIALKHFNQRSGEVLPYLPNRLKDCNFYFSWEFIDTSGSPMLGAKRFWEENTKVCRHRSRHASSSTVIHDSNGENAFTDDDDGGGDDYDSDDDDDDDDIIIESCPPFAVLGGLRSEVSHVLSLLGNAYQIPVVSPSSTLNSLDGKPLFARTLPSHAGAGKAIAIYLNALDVSHVAILYSQTPYGINFHGDVVMALQKRNIQVLSLSIVQGEADHAMEQLVASEYKYIVFLYNLLDCMELCELAYSYGVLGHPNYSWLFSEGCMSQVRTPAFSTTRADLARALHGSTFLGSEIPTHESLKQAMAQLIVNRTMQQDFIQHFQKGELIFSSYDFSALMATPLVHFAYDAVMALGIAACESPYVLFTGKQLHQSLLQTQFQGVSGPVSFDPITHTRSVSSVHYGVRNILISTKQSLPSTTNNFYFTRHLTSLVNITDESVSHIRDLVYADGTIHPPLSLPPLVQKLNLVPQSVHIAGLAFGGFILLASVVWMIWTYIHRNAPLIRASQPIFLFQLCVGTFIMGLSVIPLSLQEPTPKQLLDMACMSLPWLLSIGFVTSFSALFAKAWRLNKLFQHNRDSIRIIRVPPRDVIWPFVTLMVANLTLLVTWTWIDPLTWDRVQVPNYDSFGRSQESYGGCCLSGLPFLVPLVLVNLIPVSIALYQTWKARNISNECSEAPYLALSVASILETTVLSIPVLIAAKENPTDFYILSLLFVCALCLAVLLPIFVPKYCR